MIPGGMGDQFSDFYREAYPGAVRLAWLLTHDHAAAEDVVQDAFVRLRRPLLVGETGDGVEELRRMVRRTVRSITARALAKLRKELPDDH